MYTDVIVILILMNVQCLQNVVLRPVLKSCWFPIHQLSEIKIVLCIYLYSIFIFNIYVDSF